MPKPETALEHFSAVIITGGSSGIGKSFINLIGTLRPDISFCNLSRRRPDIIVPKLMLRHIECDLSDSRQVEAGLVGVADFLETVAPEGRVLLINNSGFGIYGEFPEPEIGQQLEMMDLNMRAVVHMTGKLLPVLKKRGGAVMTVASTAAFQPTPYMSVYGASKAFVLHWSLALNEELRGSSVRALAVCPGPTSSAFHRRAGLKEGTVPDAFGQTCEEVVLESLRALAARKPLVVCGWKNRLVTSFVGGIPKALVARMAARVMLRFRMGRVSR